MNIQRANVDTDGQDRNTDCCVHATIRLRRVANFLLMKRQSDNNQQKASALLSRFIQPLPLILSSRAGSGDGLKGAAAIGFDRVLLRAKRASVVPRGPKRLRFRRTLFAFFAAPPGHHERPVLLLLVEEGFYKG